MSRTNDFISFVGLPFNSVSGPRLYLGDYCRRCREGTDW